MKYELFKCDVCGKDGMEQAKKVPVLDGLCWKIETHLCARCDIYRRAYLVKWLATCASTEGGAVGDLLRFLKPRAEGNVVPPDPPWPNEVISLDELALTREVVSGSPRSAVEELRKQGAEA